MPVFAGLVPICCERISCRIVQHLCLSCICEVSYNYSSGSANESVSVTRRQRYATNSRRMLPTARPGRPHTSKQTHIQKGVSSNQTSSCVNAPNLRRNHSASIARPFSEISVDGKHPFRFLYLTARCEQPCVHRTVHRPTIPAHALTVQQFLHRRVRINPCVAEVDDENLVPRWYCVNVQVRRPQLCKMTLPTEWLRRGSGRSENVR